MKRAFLVLQFSMDQTDFNARIVHVRYGLSSVKAPSFPLKESRNFDRMKLQGAAHGINYVSNCKEELKCGVCMSSSYTGAYVAEGASQQVKHGCAMAAGCEPADLHMV